METNEKSQVNALGTTRSTFAVALKRQSRFAPTQVGEFLHDPKCDRHLFKGKSAGTMAELAEQVNAALQSLIDFRDPFLGIEVIQIANCKSQKQHEPFPASFLRKVGEPAEAHVA